MNLEKLQKEINKYRIEFTGISLLPFLLKFRVIYLPLNKECGYLEVSLRGIKGTIQIVEPALTIVADENGLKFEAHTTF